MNDLFGQFSQAELVPIIPLVVEPSPAAAEILVASADCPRRTYRQPTQGTLFDCSTPYQ